MLVVRHQLFDDVLTVYRDKAGKENSGSGLISPLGNPHLYGYSSVRGEGFEERLGHT